MSSPGRGEEPGGCGAGSTGEGGGAADVLQLSMDVVSAEQQSRRRGQRVGDGFGGLADLVFRQPLAVVRQGPSSRSEDDALHR
ncbi:hypothetical protein [Streptomyces sp. NPDC059466]|uniref:hypothetical protein n=1 Tax=unclassified Streptomyces TaxID=2593676 RepID=UPI0036B18BC8